MNKTELISAVAKATDNTIEETSILVDSVFKVITDELVKKEKVTIQGFGVFEAAHRKAREGRNPKTGESIDIPEKHAPVFKASKVLKDLVG